MPLSSEQIVRATEAMHEYLLAKPKLDGKTPVELSAIGDKERLQLIKERLQPLLKTYFAGNVPLDEFKSTIDGINKRHENWGFKGIKGQMFFNMLTNVAMNPTECDQEMKAAIVAPANEEMARSRIRTFASYVRRIGEAHLEGGGTKHGRPKIGSTLFFLSYFWQIQEPQIWPVYYTNSVNTMIDLNLWQPTEDLAENYIEFKRLHEELAVVFSKASGQKFDLYGVEHVFWYIGGNPYDVAKAIQKGSDSPLKTDPTRGDEKAQIDRLPDSYVPPIVSTLPLIARNEPGYEELAKASGTSLPRAFEKSINAAFTILGYDTKLMGQGAGRLPDGLAICHDNSWVIRLKRVLFCEWPGF